MPITLQIRVDLRSVAKLEKLLKEDFRNHSNTTARTGITKAATLLENYLRNRFIVLSSARGKGQWPDIAEETKRRKDSTLILRDTGALLKSIASKSTHRGISIGFIKDGAHQKSNKSVLQLAIIHHQGLIRRNDGKSTRRPIVPSDVPRQVRNKMIQAIKEGYLNAIRK